MGELQKIIADLVEGQQDDQESKETIAAPIAVELDTEEAWQDFQDTQVEFDEAYAKSLLDSTK